MADRYAELATGNNNWSSTGTWKATTDGATGASVPTSADNVYINVDSCAAGATLTVGATANCLNMDWTGATGTPTLHFGASQLSIYGNATFIADMVLTGTNANSQIRFITGTHNLTCNGAVFGTIYILAYASNCAISLQDDLSGYALSTRYTSTITTNNHNITLAFGSYDYGDGSTWNLGSSVININALSTSYGLSWAAGTPPTLSANAATINLSNTAVLAGGSTNFNGASINLNGTAHTVSGSFTCATLTINTTGTNTFSDAITVSGTMTLTAGTLALGTYNHSIGIFSSSNANARTISGSGTITLNDATAATKLNLATTTNLTWSFTGTFVLTNASANAQTFAGGDLTYNNVTVKGAGNYALTITGSNTLRTFTVDALQAAKTITGTAGTTQTIQNFVTLNRTKNVITFNSTGAAWTITGQVGIYEGEYLNLTNVATDRKYTYYAPNSTDGTGNTNWIFGHRVRYSRFPRH